MMQVGAIGQAADRPAAPDTQATQFRFEPSRAVPSLCRVKQGFGYAPSGQVYKDRLMVLAKLEYARIN
jgi:hypothetical protein